MRPTIYVAAHKAAEFPADPGYQPIHVGRALATADLGIPGDDTGDNISRLNPSFCECTALYWMWKHATAEHVGLAHYRRFFAPRTRSTLVGGIAVAASDDFGELAQGVDLVAPSALGFINMATQTQISVEQQYYGSAIGHDLFLARTAVEETAQDYLDAFDFTMRGCQIYPFNMFVGRAEVFREYAAWLFPILFKLERWIPHDTYGTYQRRVFGFIAERLFTVWVVKRRRDFRISHRDVVFLG